MSRLSWRLPWSVTTRSSVRPLSDARALCSRRAAMRLPPRSPGPARRCGRRWMRSGRCSQRAGPRRWRSGCEWACTLARPKSAIATTSGSTLNRAARIMARCPGRSDPAVARDRGAGARSTRGRRRTPVDLGEHRLASLQRPERVFQVMAPGVAAAFPSFARCGGRREAGERPAAGDVLCRPDDRAQVADGPPSRTAARDADWSGGSGQVTLGDRSRAGDVRRVSRWRLAGRSRAGHRSGFGGLDRSGDPRHPTAFRRLAAGQRRGFSAGPANARHRRQLRTRAGRGRRSHRSDQCRLSPRHDTGDKPGTARPVARGGLADHASRFGGTTLSDCSRTGRERPTLRFETDRRGRRGGDLSSSRRHAAGDRAGGGTHSVAWRRPIFSAGSTSDFELLRGGRDRVERHHTLRATIDWSYQLLSPDGRILFDRISVMAPTFDLDDVEAVCADDDLAVDKVADLLAELVDQSMVVADRTRSGTRFRELETLRQYASERLERPRRAHRSSPSSPRALPVRRPRRIPALRRHRQRARGERPRSGMEQHSHGGRTSRAATATSIPPWRCSTRPSSSHSSACATNTATGPNGSSSRAARHPSPSASLPTGGRTRACTTRSSLGGEASPRRLIPKPTRRSTAGSPSWLQRCIRAGWTKRSRRRESPNGSAGRQTHRSSSPKCWGHHQHHRHGRFR